MMDTVAVLRNKKDKFGERGAAKLKEMLDMHRELMTANVAVENITTYRDVARPGG